MSCRTLKTERTVENDITSVEVCEQTTAKVCDESALAERLINDCTAEYENVCINTVITTYSKPDSTGKQYIQSVEERKTEKRRNTDKKVTTEETINSETSVKEEYTSREDYHFTGNRKMIEDTKKTTSTPAWVIALIAGIVAIVALALIMIIKHFLR